MLEVVENGEKNGYIFLKWISLVVWDYDFIIGLTTEPE